MRIGLDIRPALRVNSRRRGIGRYTRELATSILALKASHSFLLYTIGRNDPSIPGMYDTLPLFHLRKPSRLNWLPDTFLLPRRIRRDRLDLFHGMDMMSIPSWADCPVLATVHDLIPLVFWKETVQRIPRDYAYALRRSLRNVEKADAVITDSEHSKKDLVRLLSLNPAKIFVVPLGSNVTPAPKGAERIRQWVGEYFGIQTGYLLYVGGTDYRKNLPLLLKGFARIRERGYPGVLVLVGETFRQDIPEVLEICQLIGQLGIRESVVMPGYVNDEGLARLYSGCDFFVFPSLYEGFGLPVLEAMRCGAPLLLSRVSSIPEVAADCAFYFDPGDEKQMVDTFWEAYESPDRVEENRRRGELRAQQFSWESAARRIHAVYQRLDSG